MINRVMQDMRVPCCQCRKEHLFSELEDVSGPNSHTSKFMCPACRRDRQRQMNEFLAALSQQLPSHWQIVKPTEKK